MGTNAAGLRNVYDAFAKGDMPTVLASMDPHIEWQEPESLPMFDDQVGPDAVLQNIFAVLPTVFTSFSVDVSEIHDAGDVVVAVGVYHGVGHETGRALAAHFAHVWRFGADGKITGFRTYTDTHLWRDVLGVDDREAMASGVTAKSTAV